MTVSRPILICPKRPESAIAGFRSTTFLSDHACCPSHCSLCASCSGSYENGTSFRYTYVLVNQYSGVFSPIWDVVISIASWGELSERLHLFHVLEILWQLLKAISDVCFSLLFIGFHSVRSPLCGRFSQVRIPQRIEHVLLLDIFSALGFSSFLFSVPLGCM